MTGKYSVVGALFVICGHLLAAALGAQNIPGKPLGPPGGQALSIAPDPKNSSTLYVGTAGGVFKSTDRGSTWRWTSAGLVRSRFDLMVVDPVDSSIVYALTRFFELNDAILAHRSSDGGATWEVVFSGAPFRRAIRALSIDPSDNSNLVVLTTDGHFRSTDGGENWVDLKESSGLPRGGWSLVRSPGDPSRLYTATGPLNVDFSGGPVYVSRDGGATWEPTAQERTMLELAVDAVDPDVVYAINLADRAFVSPDRRDPFLWLSTDGGASWSISPLGVIFDVAAHPRDSGTVFAARGHEVHRSTDHGETWELLEAPPQAVGGLPFEARIAVGSDGALYAGLTCGVARYHDDGWRTVNGGFFATDVLSLAVDPLNPGILYAGTRQCGLLRSVDGGTRWRQLPVLPQEPPFLNQVAVDSAAPRRLWAIATENLFESRALFRSDDFGTTWTRMDLDLRCGVELPACKAQIEIARSDPRIMYVRRDARAWLSTDRGRTFSPAAFAVVVIDPTDASTIYARATKKMPLVKTTDSARTWREVGQGLPERGTVFDLTVDPRDPQALYLIFAFGGREVYRSVDAGEHFERANSGLENELMNVILADPDVPGTIYVGLWKRGVFVSRDGGSSWQQLEELETLRTVADLQVTRAAVYAGLAHGGIVEYSKVCGEELEPMGEAFDVAGAGSEPGVAVDGRGRFLVSWTAPAGEAFARAYRAGGEPEGARFRVGVDGDTLPIVAADSLGDVLMVFQRTVPSSALWARGYAIHGKPVGTPRRVDQEPRRTKSAQALARSRTGEAVVVWESTVDGRTQLRARRLRRGGVPLGNAFTLRGGGERIVHPSVGIDAFGRSSVAWLELGSGVWSVHLQRLRTNGTVRGAAITLNAPGAQVIDSRTSVAVAPSGEIVVAWRERRPNGMPELVLRWLDAAGQPVGEGRLDPGAELFDQPAVAVDRFGNVLVVWSATDDAMGAVAVRSRIFTLAGEARSEEIVLGPGENPSLALDEGGGALVVWESGSRIRARRLRLACGR